MYIRLIAIIILLASLILSTLVYSSRNRHFMAEIQNLKSRKTELEQELEKIVAEKQELEKQSSGGAETQPVPVSAVAGTMFPIAEEDFRQYTSPFGLRVSPLLGLEMKHQGLDISATWRAQVVACANGVVIEHWPPPDDVYSGHETYGGMIKIDHGDWQSVYAHLSWSRVHEGDHVRAGQIIGRIGDTGKSDGEHLHFEVIVAGQRVNPLLYIQNPRESDARNRN